MGKALAKLPSGHGLGTAPASIGTAELNSVQKKFTISVGSIPNATKTTASTALNTAIVAEVDALIGTSMGVDTSGNTVSYRYRVTDIVRGDTPDDIFLIEANDSYFITGDFSIAVS
ncbi:hypothetical protein EP331_00365 [bacterium]|nr:MAG: hypothetical protein EP331_00365 [bacterium]